MPLARSASLPSALGPAAGRWLFEIGAIGFAMVAGAASLNSDPEHIAVIAAVIFLLGGLPHGAFDLHLAARSANLGHARLVLFTVIYIGLFALMLIGWGIAPAIILPLFLVSAALHFGADWPETGEPLFRTALGCAPICAIGIGHLSQVEAIFAAMTTPAIATWATALFILAAPVSLLVAAIALLVIARDSGWQRPAVFTAMLASLVILPPLIGFTLFFCAFHTPQHLAALHAELAHWSRLRLIAVGAGLTGLALGVAALALPLIMAGGSLTAASAFQLLAAVAMPHQSMRLILSRLDRH